MQKPSTPPDEARRLEHLRELRILDTAPESRFDRIAALAQKIFDMPIALLTFVDQKRQWFKSKAGVDQSETPRETSFCGHVILGDEIFEVPDAMADPRFSDTPKSPSMNCSTKPVQAPDPSPK
jgi:hypothetical protein